MDFYTPLLKVTSAVTIFAQRIFTIRIEGFRPVPDLKDGARVNIVSVGKRPRDFVPFNLTIEQLSSLATKQTAKASFEPLEDSLVVMHFREPGAGPPCTIVTFSPGGPQPFCSWPDVAALWGTEKCRKPRTTPPRWQRGLKGMAQLEYDYLEDLVHEWRLGCHAPIPFDDRSLRGMPMTVDELMMEVLLYVSKHPGSGKSTPPKCR
ncbi:hypothetical protein C8J57DRAFT_1223625 [Mycena rebaudengoi]|nr:hypothetical protein C8J57DRAFT_1223625 [Mycena rebaudengoi]